MAPPPTMPRQPFHLVEQSPWPLMGAASALFMTTGLISWFHLNSLLTLQLALLLTLMTMFQWWRDVTREATLQGHHTSPVMSGLRWGMILFITSEVLFFFAFFWAFFQSSIAPNSELGCVWPPSGLNPINPFAIPLLNTAILLASGATVTWAHHSLTGNNYKACSQALLITILLGMYFTFIQLMEYMEAPFTIADSVYGSTFFVATGFHGLHVLIGTSFLMVCLLRHLFAQFSNFHHFGFEAAAWYWHFVDVVWIFLFLCIYWWGS